MRTTNYTLEEEGRYRDAVDAVCEQYEPKILDLLDRIKQELESAGWGVTGPDEMHDEEFSWWLMAQFPGDNYVPDERWDNIKPEPVDVRLHIVESIVHEGTLQGINFSLDLTAYGGGIIGGYSPYNYTDKVWADITDPYAIEDRWCLFEQVDLGSIVPAINDYFARQRERESNGN